jgi:hypothetical protein
MSEAPPPEPLNVLMSRLAAIHEGNARYHLHESPEFSPERHASVTTRWSQHAMLAVSSFTIAASYWSMLDPLRAAADYWLAAMLYRALNHDYWMPLALASGHREGPRKVAHETAERTPSPASVAFAMIGDAVDRESNAREQLSALHRHYGNARIGRLGLPLDFYARCASAMASGDSRRFANAARLFLLRASEVLGSAAHDHFHWSRLHSSVLLAEPEAVAVGVAMARVARERHDRRLHEMMTDMGDEHALRIVHVSEDVFAAASSAENALRREVEAAAEVALERDLDRERETARRVERIANLVDEDFLWRLVDELNAEYEHAPDNHQRERSSAKFRALASVLMRRLPELPDHLAIFALEVHADPQRVEWLLERIRGEDEFVGRHATWAFRRTLRDASDAERERLAGIFVQLLNELANVRGFEERMDILRGGLLE